MTMWQMSARSGFDSLSIVYLLLWTFFVYWKAVVTDMIGRKSDASTLFLKIIPVCVIVAQVLIIVQLYLCSQHHVTVLRSNKSDMRKPLVVFGILTTENNTAMRDAQRTTWISAALNADIPFMLTYKFLLDEPSPKTIAENKINNDIVYLNVSHHGYAKRFGQKIYIWLKYIVENYPDAQLGARIDDDVFLCVPQIFERLNLIKSRTLYYGWAHAPGNEIVGRRRIDEMFLVLGKDLMERISKRQLCVSKTQCNEKEQLVNWDWGTGCVATWLSMYDDIDVHFDNDRIIHFGRYRFKEFAPYVRANFCENYFIYHKSTPEIMHKLHAFNKGAKVDKDFKGVPIALDKAIGTPLESMSTPVTSSGSYFSGEVIREFLLKKATYTRTVQKPRPRQDEMKHCSYWAVVTTVSAPTHAVRLVSRAPHWCLVVVADLKTPDMKVYMKDINNTNVKFLTVAEQNKIYPLLSKSIPPNNYGRKNIGYIYAMHHGANAIWDFDDSNIGMININDLDSSSEFVTLCESFHSNITNPYPYFGVANNRAWPRGFPLQSIKDSSKVPKVCERSRDVKLGVVQSLANIEPDVDAIYKLTQDVPFNFTATKETHSPLMLPRHGYAPFNAQATLWLPPAFKYMALPVSVNAEVSDIWRAYVAQHFMHRDGSHVAFTAPYVTQIRKRHEHIRNFNAELDLHRKSKQLVDFLSSKHARQIRSLVDMYRQLFRRGYIESWDIKFIVAWIQNF